MQQQSKERDTRRRFIHARRAPEATRATHAKIAITANTVPKREERAASANVESRIAAHVKYREIIADNLSKAGWSWGCVSAVDSQGRTIFVVDAHRDDGKRFVVRADEKLTAFMEFESLLSNGSQTVERDPRALDRQVVMQHHRVDVSALLLFGQLLRALLLLNR
jgi:hypothetical protein